MRIKITDGAREIEVEADQTAFFSIEDLEKMVGRLYDVVAPKDNGEKHPVGFTGADWAVHADHERRPEISYDGFDGEEE